VETLNDSLDLNLINNTLNSNDDGLLDSNYYFMYFEGYKKKKTLSDTEKLYTVFSSLYRKNAFASDIETNDDTKKYVIDEETVKNEIVSLYGTTDFTNFDNNFKQTQACGIIDYLYTGSGYELIYKECTDKTSLAKTKLIDAYKEDNYIYLTYKAFLATENDLEYLVTNFDDDTEIINTTLEELNDNYLDIFDKYEINKYTFCFELDEESYHLKEIIKES
jgi:hypothetical protein